MGWQRHHLDHMQIICTSLQWDNHASTSTLKFFAGQMLFLVPKQQRRQDTLQYNTLRTVVYGPHKETHLKGAGERLPCAMLNGSAAVGYSKLWKSVTSCEQSLERHSRLSGRRRQTFTAHITLSSQYKHITMGCKANTWRQHADTRLPDMTKTSAHSWAWLTDWVGSNVPLNTL